MEPQTLVDLITSQYYDSENITESRLSFRRATSQPPTHRLDDDSVCMKLLYDMERCVIPHFRLSNLVTERRAYQASPRVCSVSVM